MATVQSDHTIHCRTLNYGQPTLLSKRPNRGSFFNLMWDKSDNTIFNPYFEHVCFGVCCFNNDFVK